MSVVRKVSAKVRNVLTSRIQDSLGSVRTDLATQSLLQGRLASWQVRSMEVISCLHDVEFKVTSQWGEDGIIDWLVERARIPVGSQSFIEFGVENYRESNTRFLLQNRNWRGLILDGDPAMPLVVEADGLAWKHDISARSAFITRENINSLLADAGFLGEVGLLSVDVDGNDYWIWEAIEVVQPILFICEYNAVFGDIHPISIPYKPDFMYKREHFSGLYFGASLPALRSLGMKKGYRFVGTTLAGNDAFFVREDYAERFVDRSLSEARACPSRFRLANDESGVLTYAAGAKRLECIAGLPVVNIETGATTLLGELGSLYSESWQQAMNGMVR